MYCILHIVNIVLCQILRQVFVLFQLFCIFSLLVLLKFIFLFTPLPHSFSLFRNSFLHIYFLSLRAPSLFFFLSAPICRCYLALSDNFFLIFLFLSSPLSPLLSFFFLFSHNSVSLYEHLLIFLFLSLSFFIFLVLSAPLTHNFSPPLFSVSSLSLSVFHSSSLLCVFCKKYRYIAPIRLCIHNKIQDTSVNSCTFVE
jgi:hypothetical protein